MIFVFGRKYIFYPRIVKSLSRYPLLEHTLDLKGINNLLYLDIKKIIMHKHLATFLFLLFLPIGAFCADYYWIGGSGNWSDISHWATTSGGAVTHPQVPTANDNVFFDQNSFTAPGQTVTVTTDIIFFRNMDWTGVNSNPRFIGGRNVRMNVHGGIILATNMQYQFTGDLLIVGTAQGNNLDFSNHTAAYNIFFEGSGGWTMNSGIQVDSIFRINSGTLNTGDHPITCEYFYVLTNQQKSISLGASIITVTGEYILVNQFIDDINVKNAIFHTENLELDPGSSSFHFTASRVEIWKTGNFPLNLYDLEFTSPVGVTWLRIFQGTPDISAHDIRFMSNARIDGNISLNTLSLTQNKIYRLESGRMMTMNGINAVGDCSEGIILITTLNGSPVTINGNGNNLEVTHVTMRDVHATNGDFTATNSTDLGNNNNWNFTDSDPVDFYWIGGSGNWTNPNRWSFTSGGTPSGCVPTGKDNAIFDANSFNANNQTVTINIEDVYIGNMTWDGVTNQPTLAGPAEHTMHITRSMQLDPNMQHAFLGDYYFESSVEGNTVSTAGHTLNRNVLFSGVGGGWTLLDDFYVLLRIDFLSGHLNTNGVQVRTNSFFSTGTGIRHLNIENTHWILEDVVQLFLWSQWEINVTNFTLEASGSLVEISSPHQNSFRHQGQGNIEYHRVLSSGYHLAVSTSILPNDGQPRLLIDSLVYRNRGSIFGHIHLNYLEFAPGADYSIGPNFTIVIEDISAEGTCEDGMIYLFSSNSAIASNIQIVNDHILERLIIRNIRQSGTGNITANQSIDEGGNENIIFNEMTPRILYWVNGGGLWHDSNHWSASSGGPGGECIPTSVDDVIFDENSFTITGERVNSFWNRDRLCRNFTWMGTTGNPIIEEAHISIFGSMQLEENMIYNISFTNFLSASEETITTAGRRVFLFYFRGSGQYTLLDDLEGGDINHLNGDLIFNDIEVHLSRFTISDRARYTELNNSRIYLSYNDVNLTAGTFAEFAINHELNSGNSEIILTGTRPSVFSFRGKSYNIIRTTNPQGTATFYTSFQGQEPNPLLMMASKFLFAGNANLFGDMEVDSLIGSPGKTYQLQSNRTFTVTEYLRMIGNNCTPIQLQATQPGTRTTISMPTGSEIIVDFVQMRDVRGIGGAEFIAGSRSVNVNNSNENWIFEDPPEFIEVGFLGQDRALCSNESVELSAYNFSPDEVYLWNDGTTDSILVVSVSGEYHVTVTFGNNCTIIDTVNILDPSDAQIILVPDTTICEGTSLELDATLPVQGVMYLWNDGFTNPVREITEAGFYSVEAEIDECLITASAMIEVQEIPEIELGDELIRCEGDVVQLDAFYEGATYEWQDGSEESGFTVTEGGIYWAEVSINDCSVRDSVTIEFVLIPDADLGPDIEVCETEEVILSTNLLAGALYTWQDGSTGNTYEVTTSGEYFVEVSISDCINSDTVMVFIQPSPDLNLGEDVDACEGDMVAIEAGLEADAFLWSTGSEASSITVSSTDRYYLTITEGLCVLNDSIDVTFNTYPEVDLGMDASICEGEVVELNAMQEGIWQDGSVSSTFTVTESGEYSVTVSNLGCETTDEVNVEVTPDPGLDLGEDVSACEGDEVTLSSNIDAEAYFWNTGSNNPSILVTTAGNFSLTIVSGACIVEEFVSVEFNPYPEVSLGEDPAICEGESVVLDAGMVGEWQDGSVSSIFEAVEEGEYRVTVTELGCASVATTFVTVHPLPEVDLGGDVISCDGEEVILTVPDGLFEFMWEDGSLAMDREITQTGTYTLEAISEEGCVNTDAVTVTFENLPEIDLGEDLVLCEGDVFTLVANATAGVITWGDGSMGNSFQVSTPGVINAVINNNGCESNASVNVTYRECIAFTVFAPNIFAPTGSGQNDVFMPTFPDGVEILSFSMKLFDRWGNKIFETRSLEIPWDGTYKSAFSDTGVYVYILEVDYRDDREQGRRVITGDVMLVR